MNKLLIFIAAFLLTIQFSNAQTEKGSQTLGFNLGFGSGKSNESPGAQQTGDGSSFDLHNSNFSFGPAYSYFIANGLDLGAAFNFTSTKQTSPDNNFGYPLKYHDYQASGTLYARKYFLYKNKFGIRTGPFISYGKEATNFTYAPVHDYNPSNSTAHNLTAGIKVDLVYYASKNLGFAAALANLQYNHYTSSGDYQLNQTSNNISFYTGTSALQISMFYVFGGKG
ncbi:hypothetical protein [Mucilaginibacter sp.]|uniref:hypothetical protein n=1 Tax=Mucilaginibacter sp. TaxID=1882438 RepID=UPI002842720C|nr:hypothetical protein [Mucilaginibacter sp.]MDR3697262.1 hypothetical protein [Mucilaginibacter sp.]